MRGIGYSRERTPIGLINYGKEGMGEERKGYSVRTRMSLAIY